MARSKASQQRISRKISKLRKEGKPQRQAVAQAHAMERRGELGPRGGKKRGK